MSRSLQRLRSGFFIKSGALSLILALMPTLSLAENAKLHDLIAQCWDSVDGQGLEALAPYDLRYERTETPSSNATNNIWLGVAQTEYGNIEVIASIRDDVLFDCTLLSFPVPPAGDPIAFGAAAGVLSDWYGAKLRQPDHFELLEDTPFFGLVRCAPNSLTVTSSATSMAPFDPTTIAPKDAHLVPGVLRFAVHLTSPKNFEFCEGRDL